METDALYRQGGKRDQILLFSQYIIYFKTKKYWLLFAALSIGLVPCHESSGENEFSSHMKKKLFPFSSRWSSGILEGSLKFFQIPISGIVELKEIGQRYLQFSLLLV